MSAAKVSGDRRTTGLLAAALLVVVALVPRPLGAAAPDAVIDLNEVVKSWTAFGRVGDWAVYYSPVATDRAALAASGQGPPRAIAFTGGPLPGLGAFIECRPWRCGTSLQFGILLGHDVYRSPTRPGHPGSEQKSRVLLEPDAGFSQESDAHLAVASQGYPVRLSLLLSVLLPDGRPFYRWTQDSSVRVPAQTLGDMRRSNLLRFHVLHSDGSSRVHEVSLWGFSHALDVLELRCRREAEAFAVDLEKECQALIETERGRSAEAGSPPVPALSPPSEP